MMNRHLLSKLHSIVKTVLLAALIGLPVTMMHAQDKVAKHRGHIVAVDLETKSLTLDKPNGDTKVVFWDENTTLESDSATQISELKPGSYVRCIMVDSTDQIARIRHEADKDKVLENDPVE